MLHTQGLLEYSAIEGLEPERPSRAGGAWEGLAHATLVQEIRRRAAPALGAPVREAYALASGGLNCTGCLWWPMHRPVVHLGHAVQLCIAFQNNNDMRLPLQWYLGYSWHGTGFVLGELAGGTHSRYTDRAAAYDELERAAARLRQEVPEAVERETAQQLPEEERALLLVRAAGRGYLPWSRMRQAARDRYLPGTLWGALQALGTTAAMATPPLQLQYLAGFRRLAATTPVATAAVA